MSGSDEAWEDVADQFKKLGATFRDHYEARTAVDDEDVGEAVQGVGDSMRAALGAVLDAVSDPDVHEEARDTAGSFLEALGSTFAQLGADLRRRRGPQ